MINIKFTMADQKVLTDPNLLNIILSFTGIEIKKKCAMCDMVIKYQILNQQIEYNHESYIILEMCKKKYFCNEDCLDMYKQRFNNESFCVMLTLICIIVGLLIVLLVFLLESIEVHEINIDLSV